MNGQTTYRYISNSNDWTRELTAAFGGGFLLATLLWLGLWYFQTRPAQAGALQERESAVQELELRLERCTAERQRAGEASQRLEGEVAQLHRQIKQAWAAAGRCAR